MKKCIVIPDSFKGTLSSMEICEIMRNSIHKHYPDCEVIEIPIADGGEGTVDCFLKTLRAEAIQIEAEGPYGDKIPVTYARMGDCAVIEVAAAAGLPMAERLNRLDPCHATTYGLGTIMKHAICSMKCRKLIIGLGGSCTNDGGIGMAKALGGRFYNKAGKEFFPAACEMEQIERMDISEIRKLTEGIEIIGMCDIDNPMFGPSGAAYVFGPQKGADPDTVQLLDTQLKALAKAMETSTGRDVSELSGGGAAGGLGAGLAVFTEATLRSGIQTLLELVGFDELVQDADMVFTGEGKLDVQSLRGKAVIGIAQRTKKYSIPVIAVVGAIGDGVEAAYNMGVSAVFSINRQPMPFDKARHLSNTNLEGTMDNLLRYYKSTHGM